MPEFLIPYFPNLNNYWEIFLDSLSATWQMFVIAGLLTFLIGLLAGIGLSVTRKNALCENRLIHGILECAVNIFRSVPFIILLIFLIPLSRAVTGTAIGVAGAIVPLVFGAVPFFARQTESALSEVSEGKIEAAKAMGSSPLGIIFRVLLRESVPSLIRATTITAISLIGLTTAAGAVGAGGIGSFAINYGQNLHYQDIVNVCVLTLLILICFIQLSGNALARLTTNRKLIFLVRRSVQETEQTEAEQTAQILEYEAALPADRIS